MLILLAVLLLPYLLAPFYRSGHPVSTLMAWRWLRGAPVSRQWIDFKAIAPALPRSVVASEDAKYCSHHGIDWDAVRDVIDDAQEGEVLRKFLGHTGGNNVRTAPQVCFSSDGERILSSGADHTVRLWNSTNAEELKKLPPFAAAKKRFIALAPDDSALVGGQAIRNLAHADWKST